MKKYRVEVTETLSRIVEVDANSLLEALQTARARYQSCQIVLDASDYVKTEFCVKDEKSAEDVRFSRINR